MQKVVPLIPARPKIQLDSIWMHEGEHMFPYHTEEDAVHSAALEVLRRIEEIQDFLVAFEEDEERFEDFGPDTKSAARRQAKYVYSRILENSQREQWKTIFCHWNEFWEDWDSDNCIRVYGMTIGPKGYIQSPHGFKRL